MQNLRIQSLVECVEKIQISIIFQRSQLLSDPVLTLTDTRVFTYQFWV